MVHLAVALVKAAVGHLAVALVKAAVRHLAVALVKAAVDHLAVALVNSAWRGLSRARTPTTTAAGARGACMHAPHRRSRQPYALHQHSRWPSMNGPLRAGSCAA